VGKDLGVNSSEDYLSEVVLLDDSVREIVVGDVLLEGECN
jgi:hypothetical protein